MTTATRQRVLIWALAALVAAPLAYADFDQAMGFFKAGKYAEAAAEFQALVDQAPNYDSGHYLLGLSFFKMGKNKEAADNIKKAIELNGDKFEYHHALASVYRAQKGNTRSLRTLNDAEGLVDNRTKFAFYSLRGFVNADLDKWGEAVNDLEKARSVKQSTQVLDYLGKAYFKLGYHDKAVPVLRESCKLNPNDANTHMFLAEALVNLGKEASDDTRKAQHFAEALQVAKKYRSMRPDDYRAVNLLGRAALGAGDFRTAEEAFVKVIGMKPDYCYAMVNLSKCLIAMERWRDAEKAARDATTCAPRLTAGYESLGYALQKQKRLEDALGAYQQAYNIRPSASIRQLMEVVEENIRIREENKQLAEEEQKQQELIEAEQARIAEEEKKRREWEKKRDE